MAEGLQRRIEYSDLKFISSFAMEKILDFQTWEEPGEHARGNFRLLLSENETGEVLRESQWIETDAGYKLLYSEAYEKAVNQLYFNEDVSDGKMLEEQAARALFYYMYSDEGDYDSIVVRTYKQEQSVYVYQFPEDQEFPCVRNFSCRGMTEDQEYYILQIIQTIILMVMNLFLLIIIILQVMLLTGRRAKCFGNGNGVI